MTLTQIASDISSRIADMAKDSPLNNATLIENLLTDHMAKQRMDYDLLLQQVLTLQAENEALKVQVKLLKLKAKKR